MSRFSKHWVLGLGMAMAMAMAPALAFAQSGTAPTRLNERTRGVKIIKPVPPAPVQPVAIPAPAPVPAPAPAKPVQLAPVPVNTPAPAPAKPIQPALVAVPTPAPAPNPSPVVPLRPATAVTIPIIKPCDRPYAQTALRLDTDTRFARSLERIMKLRKPFVVDLAVPYASGGEIPAQLAPWLSEIKSSGGSVTVANYCNNTRGGFGNWLSRLFGGDPGKMYRPARLYDAVLHANSVDRVVTQVEFLPRPSDTGK